jgi:threonine/homoserine/homoserine lactone efflux protein
MMPILAMISFSFVMSVTPGPGNMIILSSGISYGWRIVVYYLYGLQNSFFKTEY